MKNLVKLQILIFLLLAGKSSFSQEVENELQTRTNIDLSISPVKKLTFSLTPELRFDQDFSLDKYLLEAGLKYKATKWLSLRANYGLVGNLRNEKDTEYFNRFAFSTTFKKKIKRFEPSFRLMYSNYADDEITDKNFLRYKAGIEYNIRNFKLTPFAAVQFFQDVNNGGLYKTRYAIGADYKLFKNNYLNASYKFDYYNTSYLNKHIFSIGYKIKF